MEFQYSYKTKNKGNKYSIFNTLGNEQKIDYELIEKSLSSIKNDVTVFETFLSPKSKLAKKMGRRKLRFNPYIKSIGMTKNSSSFNSLNMPRSSSNSLDKLFKNRFSVLKTEETNENKPKDIKPKKKEKKSRNLKLTSHSKKDNLFITSFKMNTVDEENNKINPINIRQDGKKTHRTIQTQHLKRSLPPIKSKSTVTKENIKSIDYVNKIINEDYKNSSSYGKMKNPLIIKKNRFLTIDEDVALNMIKKQQKIVKKINNVRANFENINVFFEAKYKYLNWKYGLADVNKYFIDIDTYKKDPQDLINNKKSFYDRLDDMVDKINEEKEKKDMENIKKQYGININKKKDNVDYDKGENADEYDKLFLKGRKIKNILRETYQRKILEKKIRDKIKSILESSRDKINIINKNFQSYKMKTLKEMAYIQSENKNNIKNKKDKAKDKAKDKSKKKDKQL